MKTLEFHLQHIDDILYIDEPVTYKDNRVGYIKSVQFINGNPHYEIVITDEDTIRKIAGDDNLISLGLGYKKL